jgi:hypothetical protein
MTHAIPFAIAVSFIFISILLYSFVSIGVNLPGIKKFILRIIFISVVSAGLLFLHTYTLPLYIDKSNLVLLLLSLPFIFISAIVILIFLKKNGVEIEFLNKITRKLWKAKR